MYFALFISTIHDLNFTNHSHKKRKDTPNKLSLSQLQQFHNIMRLFDVLSNFPFTTSETMGDYFLQTWYIQVASQVAERLKAQKLRKLGNIGKVSKPPQNDSPVPSLPFKMKVLLILAENS